MDSLRKLFGGYAQLEVPPMAFVLFGNFTSEPYGPAHIKTLKGEPVPAAVLHPTLRQTRSMRWRI